MFTPSIQLRKRPAFIFAVAAVMCASISGCGRQTPSIDPVAHQKEITTWQEKRAKGISGENSWLTLSGLYWLKPGENPFGTDSSNTVILPPGKGPKNAGTIIWKDSLITLRAKPGAGVMVGDSAVTSVRLRSDADGDPTLVTLGSVSFLVIKRGDQMGIRVRDRENTARLRFTGLDFFPAATEWRIEGRYEAYPAPRTVPITSVIGTVTNDTFPGAVVFSRNGSEYRLMASVERGRDTTLYIMFSDETSGKETYGIGRQLSTPMPDPEGKVIIDFNKAYNWPCAYTDFATCPIPPRENHLPFRIEAGEKNYPGHEGH